MTPDQNLRGTGRGAAGKAGGGGGSPPAMSHGARPLHQPAAGPPAGAAEEFIGGATRLAGHMGLAFGWTPDSFWAATPADIAALVRAAAGDVPDALGSNDLARLMEAFPDG